MLGKTSILLLHKMLLVYSRRELDCYQGFSPQPNDYEVPVSLQITPRSQAAVAENCVSYSQTSGGMQFEMNKEQLQALQEGNLEDPAHVNFYDTIADSEIRSAALPSSTELTYSHLHQNQATCEVSNGGHEYSEINQNKDMMPPPRPNQTHGQCTFDDPQYAAVSDPNGPSL